MASVDLTETFLHLASDLKTYVTLQHEDSDGDVSPRAQVEERAAGRRRLIARPGSDSRISYRAEQVDTATFDQLETWTDESTTLVHRDPNGRVWWGHIARFGFRHRPASGGDITDVDITFVRLDDDAEV